MKLSWTTQWFDNCGLQTEISTAVLLLKPGQEFAAGYARIMNDNGIAILKIIQDHEGLKVAVGKVKFPVTQLNEKVHSQLSEQELKTGDVLQVFAPTKAGAIVTTLTLLPDRVPATRKI